MCRYGNPPDWWHKEKENIMSMDCDTRLSMMAMRQRAHDAQQARPTTRRRTRIRRAGAAVTSGMASFALTLFTRVI
jgi:hypothetical protein